MKVILKKFILGFILLSLCTPVFALSASRDTAYTSNARSFSRYYQPRAVLVNRNQMQRRNNYIFTPQQARYYGYRTGINGTGYNNTYYYNRYRR